MPGLNSSLYIGLTGLNASQSALNVVGHNIANVNTPGYTRQRADLSSNRSAVQGDVFFGTGVSLNTVTGIRDKFLDLQIYQETAIQSGADQRYATVNAISTSLGDTSGSGIAAQIQSFFQGFQDLAAAPESSAMRTNVIGKADAMITALQTQYRLLDDQRKSADLSVANLVEKVNSLTSQIAKLNGQITNTIPGAENNDGIDQRKALTEELSTLIGINVFEGSRGEYQITLGSGAATLVSGGDSYKLLNQPGAGPDGYSAVGTVVGNPPPDLTATIKNGQLGGQLDLRDNILAGFQRQLDQIAAGVASEVNQLHRAGYGVNSLSASNNNTDFFQAGVGNYAVTDLANGEISGLPTGISATNFYKGMVNSLAVNKVVSGDPSLIATGGAGTLGAMTGDNSVANAIADLQNKVKTVDSTGDGVGDSGPYSTSVGSLVSDLGTHVQKFKIQSTTQQNLVLALQSQRDQVSGVNLDEEAANMMNLQRGYQASARFINVINQLTDQLVNQFGV